MLDFGLEQYHFDEIFQALVTIHLIEPHMCALSIFSSSRLGFIYNTKIKTCDSFLTCMSREKESNVQSLLTVAWLSSASVLIVFCFLLILFLPRSKCQSFNHINKIIWWQQFSGQTWAYSPEVFSRRRFQYFLLQYLHLGILSTLTILYTYIGYVDCTHTHTPPVTPYIQHPCYFITHLSLVSDTLCS